MRKVVVTVLVASFLPLRRRPRDVSWSSDCNADGRAYVAKDAALEAAERKSRSHEASGSRGRATRCGQASLDKVGSVYLRVLDGRSADI